MMKIEDCRLFDQSFTHLTLDNQLTVFNTSTLDRHLRFNLVTPEWIAIKREQVLQIINNHGVEEEHLKRLKEDCLSRPLIVVEWNDGTHTLVDGNHRIVFAHRRNRKEVLGWMVKQEVWKNFAIELPPGANVHEYLKASTGRIIPNDVVITIGRY